MRACVRGGSNLFFPPIHSFELYLVVSGFRYILACVGEVICFFFPHFSHLDRVQLSGLGCVCICVCFR